jgi:Rrf2 family cysteine metabolism transcriptional repressor
VAKSIYYLAKSIGTPYICHRNRRIKKGFVEFMKLSTRARYALRMMVEIAKNTDKMGGAVSLSHVAETTGISRRYLEQLAIGLKNACLVKGKTGKGGGYHLAKKPGKITAAQVIEAAIGPISIVDCVLDPEFCMRIDKCGCRTMYCKINDRIMETLNELSLEELAKNGTSKAHPRKASTPKKRKPRAC